MSVLTDQEQMEEMLDRKVALLRQNLIGLIVDLEATTKQAHNGTFQLAPSILEDYQRRIGDYLDKCQEASDLAGDLIVSESDKDD